MSKETETLQTPPQVAGQVDAPAETFGTASPIMTALPRAQIVASKTNPRTHFDAAYIQELRASIQEHGILQPLLVRPLPAARLQDTFEDRAPGAPLPTHEIVCGECRWRASVDDAEIPVLIRHLDDIQVLQVQLVENLKRRDLHPLEEAEGFERLMKDHGMTVEEIAAKVDKSVSQIYVTLKLLELTPECREELFAGKLTRSTALLVARAPAYLQAQIAKDIMHSGFDGEPMSYRQAQRHIQQHYMLQLANAVFDIKDERLVAKAGSCATCAKNTGANADMFEDVKGGDTCTDPKCFDAKKVAHFAAVAKAAEAKGQKVIQGKEAKELMPHEYSDPKGYTLLDESRYINGRSTSVRKAIGTDAPTPVLIINPHTKLPQEALPTDVANKLLKKAEAKAGADRKTAEKNKEPSARDLEIQFADAWHDKAMERIHAAILAGRSQGITVGLARQMALYYSQSLYAESEKRFVRLFDVPDGKVGTSAAVDDFLKTCPDASVGPALLVLMLEDELNAMHDSEPLAKYQVLQLIAGDAGVDVKAVQDEVKADMKAAAEARKAEAAAKASKGKKPEPKAMGKKTTAADAKAGIAQALQDKDGTSANDFEVGQRVRFKQDLKGHTGKLRKVSGREGTIKSKIGDRAWSVSYGTKAHEVATADYTELEHVELADTPVETSAGPFPTSSKADKKAKTTKPAPAATVTPQSAWPFPTATRP